MSQPVPQDLEVLWRKSYATQVSGPMIGIAMKIRPAGDHQLQPLRFVEQPLLRGQVVLAVKDLHGLEAQSRKAPNQAPPSAHARMR